MVRRQADGAITFRLWKSGVTRDLTTAAGVTTTDAWNHVVATWNGSRIELWVNGVSRGSMALARADRRRRRTAVGRLRPAGLRLV